MITQNFLDWLRDIFVNIITVLSDALDGLNAEGAGAAIGSVMGQASHLLGLFISPSVWPAVLTAWTAWLSLWAITGLIAVFARRGTST